MRKAALFLVGMILLGGWALAAAAPSRAQAPTQEYFPQTGHWVEGDFLAFYQQNPEAEALYGWPITDAFADQDSGLQVQYFQKARFELHPDATAELRVQLTPLGYYLYTPAASLINPTSITACQTFSETGFAVCHSFLGFYQAHGGAAQLGFPISNYEIHSGRIVQYFQRARLEWWPERGHGARVVLAHLGEEYFKLRGENPALKAPNLTDRTLQTILKLQVQAFPRQAVVGRSGSQSLNVIVQDQNFRPVANAQVSIVVRLPQGSERRYILPPSDGHGLTQFTFPYETSVLGIAQIEVSASYDTLESVTSTSFRIWY